MSDDAASSTSPWPNFLHHSRVESGHADIVVDASHLGMLRKLGMLLKLWRLRATPVTLLH